MDNIRFKNGSYLYLSQQPVSIDDFADELIELAVTTIVVLLPLKEMERNHDTNLVDEYEMQGFKVLHFPIQDFDVPHSYVEFDELIEAIKFDLKQGKNVLIHCAGGRGRTGTVAAGIVVSMGKDVEASIEYVRNKREGSVETDQQKMFLVRYERFLQIRKEGKYTDDYIERTLL